MGPQVTEGLNTVWVPSESGLGRAEGGSEQRLEVLMQQGHTPSLQGPTLSLQDPQHHPCRASNSTPAGSPTPTLQGLQHHPCRAPTSTQGLYQGSVCHLGAWDCQALQQ